MSKYFKCTTNKNPLTYTCGEKIIFSVTAKDNCIDTPCEYIYWKLMGDDGKVKEGISSFKPGAPLIIETELERPGFVYLTCISFNDTGNPDNVFDTLSTSAGADILGHLWMFCLFISYHFQAVQAIGKSKYVSGYGSGVMR